MQNGARFLQNEEKSAVDRIVRANNSHVFCIKADNSVDPEFCWVALVRKVYRKPGSVLLCGAAGNYPPALSDNHLSRPFIAKRLKRPT